MTNAEKIAALEAAKATLEDMIIVTARTFTEFGSAEHAQVGHIAALYSDLSAVDDLLYSLRERESITVTTGDGISGMSTVTGGMQ